MKKYVLKPDIYWVGAVDYSLRDFHRYSRSPQGSTYNAYLVLDEKNVLFDTVSHGFYDEFVKQISNIIEPRKIDYIVCNHLEKDHSAMLAAIVALCKPEKIFVSVMGEKSMKCQFNTEGWPIHVVRDGERINIGKRNITFLETRMLHWPDSMVSYLEEDKVLISNDAFGQNIGASQRFADEYDRSLLLKAMKEYYYNIILPFSPLVLKTLDRIGSLGLRLDIIAPDHGLIFRTKEDIDFVLNAYREFAEQKTKVKAVIAYESMWDATSAMAYAVGEGLAEEDVPFALINVQKVHCSEVMNALADASGLILGSATRNNMPMVNMMGVLANIKGLKPRNLVGGSFGSYGWSGEAAKMLSDELAAMKVEVAGEPVRSYFYPTPDDFEKCRELGRQVARALKARAGR